MGTWDVTPGSSQPELILMMPMHWTLGPATEQRKHVDAQVTLDYAQVSPDPAPVF